MRMFRLTALLIVGLLVLAQPLWAVPELLNVDSAGIRIESKYGTSVRCNNNGDVAIFYSYDPYIGERLFRRVRSTGITTMFTKNVDGSDFDGNIDGFKVSADGNRVVFVASGGHLDGSGVVPPNASRTAVYLYDHTTGDITLISKATDGSGGTCSGGSPCWDGFGTNPAISPDGNIITFVSSRDLFSNPNPSYYYRTYRYNVSTGALTQLPDLGFPPADSSFAAPLYMSNDGNRFVFANSSGYGADAQCYHYDWSTGLLTLVSKNTSGGNSSGYCFLGGLSADGSKVVYNSEATDIVPGVPARSNIYMYDTNTGTTTVLNRPSSDLPPTFVRGVSSSYSDFEAVNPSIDGSGNWVAFSSASTNLVPGVFNGVRNLYVVNVSTGAIRRANFNYMGGELQYDSWSADITGDSSTLCYEYERSDIVPGIPADSYGNVFATGNVPALFDTPFTDDVVPTAGPDVLIDGNYRPQGADVNQLKGKRGKKKMQIIFLDQLPAGSTFEVILRKGRRIFKEITSSNNPLVLKLGKGKYVLAFRVNLPSGFQTQRSPRVSFRVRGGKKKASKARRR